MMQRKGIHRGIIWGVMCVMMLVSSMCFASTHKGKIFIDNVEIPLDSTTGNAIVKNGRTFVPIRVVSENLGYKVDWIPNLQTVIISDGKLEVALEIGKSVALINGVETPIDVRDGKPVDTKSFIQNGRTYVPIRFIGEAFGCTVNYSNGNVYITTKNPIQGYVPVTSVISNWNQYAEGRLANIVKSNYLTGEVTALMVNYGTPFKVEHPEKNGNHTTVYDMAWMYEDWDALNVKTNTSTWLDILYIKDGKVIGTASGFDNKKLPDGKQSIRISETDEKNRELFNQADQLGFCATGSHNVAIMNKPSSLRTEAFFKLPPKK